MSRKGDAAAAGTSKPAELVPVCAQLPAVPRQPQVKVRLEQDGCRVCQGCWALQGCQMSPKSAPNPNKWQRLPRRARSLLGICRGRHLHSTPLQAVKKN